MKYLKTIYSLYFPEVRQKLEELWETKPHYLFDNNFLGAQEGKENEFLNKWIDWTASTISLNKDFKHKYVTAGSSEAIREFIYNIASKGHRLVLFENDYEGYRSFAEAANCNYVLIQRSEYSSFMFNNKDVVILSNPSSIDGAVWREYDNFCKYLLKEYPQVEIAVDLCYVGICVNNIQINCSYSNISTIFFSLSKVFGVYYHRIGGIMSKKELLGLVGNKWFKNMFSLEFGIILMKSFKINELAIKYSKYKKEIESQIEQDLKIKIKENDVLILSYSDEFKAEFARGANSRICITPALFEKIEKDFNENN